jgi:small-conductance mechanosensitive channel
MPSEPSLAEELARERDEVQRLRALLVAKDAELGTVLGRRAELEARAKQLLRGVVRMRAKWLALTSKLAARLRGTQS